MGWPQTTSGHHLGKNELQSTSHSASEYKTSGRTRAGPQCQQPGDGILCVGTPSESGGVGGGNSLKRVMLANAASKRSMPNLS